MKSLLQCVALVAMVSIMIDTSSADLCVEVSPSAQASSLPDFSPDEFQVDIEMASKERRRVIQTRLYYSRPKQMIRLSTMDQSQPTDLYYYFMDNEVMGFDYSQGRGQCTVQNISQAAESFIVGGSKSTGKIPEPLGVLRMMGASGFGTNPIRVQKGTSQKMRSMDVDVYTSCQRWAYKNQALTLKVTHFMSPATPTWKYPDGKVVPIAIQVEGSGIMKNQTRTNLWHKYNFFNMQFSVNPTDLETPEGIYCQRRKFFPFPPSPTYIKFNAESINNAAGQTTYMEEIFDIDDKFAIMNVQDPGSYSSPGGFGRRTYFRDYITGLSFDMDNKMQSCAIRNISDQTEIPLPFDFIQNGRVSQLSADAFFYKGKNQYQYLGEKTVRNIPCDTFITKAPVLKDSSDIATIEWYFAKNGTRSWNDGTQFYKNGGFRLPVKFRLWMDDNTKLSTDVNIYHVDYAKLRYGAINVKTCFPNSPSNYFHLILPGAKKSVVDANIDQFKWTTLQGLAQAAQVIWWRIADIQIYFEVNDAIVEFELLDAPPYSGDAPQPYNHVSLQAATTNIQNAINSGYSLMAFEPTNHTFTKAIPVSKSFQLQANKPLANNDGFGAGAMAGVGIALLLVGGIGGGVGAHFLIK